MFRAKYSIKYSISPIASNNSQKNECVILLKPWKLYQALSHDHTLSENVAEL